MVTRKIPILAPRRVPPCLIASVAALITSSCVPTSCRRASSPSSSPPSSSPGTAWTLSIHSIVTARRELFYWATVTATFALGTATGDLTAVTAHLGYLVVGRDVHPSSSRSRAWPFATPGFGRGGGLLDQLRPHPTPRRLLRGLARRVARPRGAGLGTGQRGAPLQRPHRSSASWRSRAPSVAHEEESTS